MKKEEIKEKLLRLGLFIDNEWLDKYCELIENNKNTKREKYKTQSHHIIPKCYYTMNKLKIDNSKENLVNLLYKDHILAHCYLCLCSEGNFHYKLVNAFTHLINRKWKYRIDDINNIDLNIYQKLYEEWVFYLENNEERKNKISKNRKGIKHTKEEIEKMKNKKLSKETKFKISKATSKKVQCLETGEVYDSASAAERHIRGKITSAIASSAYRFKKGKNHLAYNYHWVYLEMNNNFPYNEKERFYLLENLPKHKKKAYYNKLEKKTKKL